MQEASMDVQHVSTDPPSTQQDWHVLYVRTGFEPIVEGFLHRKGYESYLPIAHIRRHGTDLIRGSDVSSFSRLYLLQGRCGRETRDPDDPWSHCLRRER